MGEDWCVPTANPKDILIMDTYFLQTKLVRNLTSMLNTSTRMQQRHPNELRRIHANIMKQVRLCNRRDKALRYLWQADLVCVPVHSNLHWSMVVMDFRSYEFRIYDSFYTAKNIPYPEVLCLIQVFFFLVPFFFVFIFLLLLNSICTRFFILTIKCMHFLISGTSSFGRESSKT